MRDLIRVFVYLWFCWLQPAVNSHYLVSNLDNLNSHYLVRNPRNRVKHNYKVCVCGGGGVSTNEFESRKGMRMQIRKDLSPTRHTQLLLIAVVIGSATRAVVFVASAF